MMREAERACDDRVVRGGADPTSYGRLLLEFAASARNGLTVPVTATAMTRTSDVETRLLAVLDPTIRREGPSRRLDVALGSVASVLAIAFAAITLDAAPPQTPTRDVVQSPAQSEPDRRADSLASPASERVPQTFSDVRVRSALTAALAGPDSMLAVMLRTGLAHRAQSSADLVSERAAWALSQERNANLVAPLLDSLRSRDWRVQAYAAWALGHARNEVVDARLAPLLDHPVWRVRAMGASVLHGTRNADARQKYVRALSDDAWQVRTAAVEHFAAVRDTSVLDRLRALSNDRHVAVRNAVAAALASR
jgi:HEAT repeat protein